MRPHPLHLLPLTLLLGAAPDRIPFPASLPACRRGEFLTAKDGVLLCRDLVYKTLSSPPDCNGGLAGPASPVSAEWTCLPKGHVDPTAVAALPDQQARAEAAQKTVTSVLAQPPEGTAFLGLTKVKSTGLIRREGVEPGLLSANALCSDEYPGSHLCTGYEVSTAAAFSQLPTAGVPQAWVFHPSWKTPLAGAQDPELGLADTCASFTYDKDDRGWSGISFAFQNLTYNGNTVVKFFGGSKAPCSAMLPPWLLQVMEGTMRSLVLLTFVILGAGCDPAVSAEVPVCKDGAALGFDDSGAPVCQGLGQAGDAAPLPVCTPNEALTIEAGAVRCVPRTDAASLMQIHDQLNALMDLLSKASSALDSGTPSPTATFVGLPPTWTAGRITSANSTQFGLYAAAESCSAQFGEGSHLCSPYELHLSAALGIFKPGTNVSKSWVYFPAWNRLPQDAAEDREAGLGDTCAGYTIHNSIPGYRGVLMEWLPLQTGATGFVFHSGNDANCTGSFPMACCR